MLEQGTLYFSRNQTQMLKGKVLGSIDLGLSFIHTDAASRRIDIDGEHQVLHLKVSVLCQHIFISSIKFI